MPRSVPTNMHSPVRVRPLTYFASRPSTIFSMSRKPSHIRCVGLLTMLILLSTGSPFQYFNPSQRRRVATFACVTMAESGCSGSSAAGSLACGNDVAVRSSGGCGPPRVTDETKPAFCRAKESERRTFVEGIEVRPNRALEQFCRCEQTWANLTRDMMRRRVERR